MQVEYAAAYPDLYRRHWWWRARERVLVRTIRRTVAGMHDVRILDVGCGAGLFFDVLEQFGHVEGVESDRASVERSGRWRPRIAVGNLSDEGPQFDLILLLDVLEHVADPHGLLRTVTRRLSERGLVIITVPAFKSLWTSHDVLNQHVTRYSRSSLTPLLERAGLAPRRMRYLFQSLVVPKFVTRLIESLRSATPRIPSVPPQPANLAIQAWLGVEDAVFGWLPFGGSLLAVAEAARGRVDSPSEAADGD